MPEEPDIPKTRIAKVFFGIGIGATLVWLIVIVLCVGITAVSRERPSGFLALLPVAAVYGGLLWLYIKAYNSIRVLRDYCRSLHLQLRDKPDLVSKLV
jgi:hypothetical protein